MLLPTFSGSMFASRSMIQVYLFHIVSISSSFLLIVVNSSSEIQRRPCYHAFMLHDCFWDVSLSRNSTCCTLGGCNQHACWCGSFNLCSCLLPISVLTGSSAATLLLCSWFHATSTCCSLFLCSISMYTSKLPSFSRRFFLCVPTEEPLKTHYWVSTH